MCIAETNSLYSMKRIALLLTAIALTCASANAQSFLEKFGNRAKNAVERNLGNKVEKAVNDALDGNKNFLRGIRIGLFYPELFELPKGYTMKTIDLTRAMGALRNNNNR